MSDIALGFKKIEITLILHFAHCIVFIFLIGECTQVRNFRWYFSASYPESTVTSIIPRFPDPRFINRENGNYCWRISKYFCQAESILGTPGKKLCHGTKTRLKLHHVSLATTEASHFVWGVCITINYTMCQNRHLLTT